MTKEWTDKHLPNTATFSKDPSMWGLSPNTRVTSRDGCKVKLNNHKNWLIDWTSSLGASIFGYTTEFKTALHKQIILGIDATLTWHLESEVAEKLATLLKENVPGWHNEQLGVRWCSSGTDATTMAVRLARAITGRDKIICYKNHYHGWSDWTVTRTEPASGIPYNVRHQIIELPFNDINWIKTVLEDDLTEFDIAAIIFEHPVFDTEVEYWQQVRELCNKHNVLLVADEVVTGLRYGLGGACELYGIEPDLVCMGKALGNGLPIGALIGRQEYMDKFAGNEPVFCSSTGWGNALSLAAANFVLDRYLADGDKLDLYLLRLGSKLLYGLRESYNVIGHLPRSVIQFESLEQRAFFIQEMIKRGHLMNRPNILNLAMTEDDVDNVIQAASEVKEEMNKLASDYKPDRLPRVLFEGR